MTRKVIGPAGLSNGYPTNFDTSAASRSVKFQSNSFAWPTLPQGAPELLLKNTIYVRDLDRILMVRDTERSRNLQALVRRYILQIVYGCQEPTCQTPTCFSCRKRVSAAPVRRFTNLSARTLACYLVSLDDSEKNLCPHTPVVPVGLEDHHPLDPELQKRKKKKRSTVHMIDPSASERAPATANGTVETSKSRKPIDGEKANIEIELPERASLVTGDPAQENDQKVAAQAEDTGDTKRKQYRKDPKSFTQNLFDTVPLRLLEWYPIPSPKEMFNFAPDGEEENGSYVHLPARRHHKHRHRHTKLSSEANPGYAATKPALEHGVNGVSQSRDNSVARIANASNRLLPDLLRPDYDGRHASRDRRPFSFNALPDQANPPRRHRQDSINSGNSLPPHPRSRSQQLAETPKGRPSSSDLSIHLPLKKQSLRTRLNGPPDGEQRIDERKTHRRYSWSGSQTPRRDSPATPSRVREPDVKLDKDSGARFQEGSRTGDRHKTRIDQPRYVKPPQSLFRLSTDIVDALIRFNMTCDCLTQTQRDFLGTTGRAWAFRKRHCSSASYLPCRSMFHFTDQSIFYVFSNAEAMLGSFVMSLDESSNSTTCPPAALDVAFRSLMDWKERLFKSLWHGLEAVFNPPPDTFPPRSPNLKILRNPSHSASQASPTEAHGVSQAGSGKHLTDQEASHIVILCLHALVAPFDPVSPVTVSRLQYSRVWRPDDRASSVNADLLKHMVECHDVFEDEIALRLVRRLLKAVAARICFVQATRARSLRTDFSSVAPVESPLLDAICERFAHSFWKLSRRDGAAEEHPRSENTRQLHPWSMPVVFLEWVRAVIIKEWDGKEEINRFSVVGDAITILKHFRSSDDPTICRTSTNIYSDEKREDIGLDSEMFWMPNFAERLDPMDIPVEWHSSSSSNRIIHLLSNPFLFQPAALVTYFRAINFSIMTRSFENAMMTLKLVLTLGPLHPADKPDKRLLRRLKTAVASYLVLEVRRDNVLVDALNQLWRRERRELLRPLKVKMGMQEGEEGMDHGGVQQEFFRIAIAEALHPKYGLFTTDSRTRMTWFEAQSLEPLYKFELIGLLVSLAIYNGVTLPVTLPLALYRKLLGLPVEELGHIEDGWPDLYKGLKQFMDWSTGDVGDVFMRTYEFTTRAWGRTISIDMQKVKRDDPWPEPVETAIEREKSREDAAVGADYPLDEAREIKVGDRTVLSTGDEAALVTNQNRDEYVKDYIYWLTDKSIRPQYDAFVRGFYACLDRKSVSIFTPETLQTVVEGTQDFDIHALEQITRYEDGYSPNHQTILDFWSILREFPAEDKRKLLEFVTASDRVPVSGVSSIQFIVQRNGPDSEV
ncbi:MAG: hypothetical protein M1833_006346 [Piccolia ochrophora]|nr:MAG: hypothetical protein M1833_006346 [Piccolia ochrophora]